MLAFHRIRPALATGLVMVALSRGLSAQTLESPRAPGDTTKSDWVSLAPAKPKTRADTAKVPFAFADFTWLNGNSRQKTSVLDSKYFTGEFRIDATYSS